jgi:hypothetical protein
MNVAEEISGAMHSMLAFSEIEAHRAFNQAFTTAVLPASNGESAAFISPDGEPMISANHTFNNGNVWDNLLPAAALSTAAFDEVMSRAGKFVDPKGVQKPLFPNTLITCM